MHVIEYQLKTVELSCTQLLVASKQMNLKSQASVWEQNVISTFYLDELYYFVIFC